MERQAMYQTKSKKYAVIKYDSDGLVGLTEEKYLISGQLVTGESAVVKFFYDKGKTKFSEEEGEILYASGKLELI